MAAIIDGNYSIISRPNYDEKLLAWHAYGSVWRNDGGFLYHQLKLEEIFQTEREALDFGYAAVRTWVNKQSDQPTP